MGPLNLERSSNVPLRAPQRTSAEGPASSEKGQEATSYASPEEQTPLPPQVQRMLQAGELVISYRDTVTTQKRAEMADEPTVSRFI